MASFLPITRGKSLPSIHIDITGGSKDEVDGENGSRDERFRDGMGSLPRDRQNSSMEHLQRPSVAPPTITVTEHSPVSSIQFFINQESGDSPKEDEARVLDDGQLFYPPCRQLGITRSQTDSNIFYFLEGLDEASGSTHYITPDGRIDLQVVLKAVHAVTLRDTSCSLRVCEVILNILQQLLHMHVLPKFSGNKG